MAPLEEIDWDSFPCDSCDLCLEVCPVYHHTEMEEDSPRNRIKVAEGLVRDELVPGGSLFDVMFRSSMCGRCDDVCPSDIPVTEVIEATRSGLIENCPDRSRGMIDRLLREGTPFSTEPPVEMEGEGSFYFADPVSRSTGIANSVIRAIAISGSGFGVVSGNSGLYNRVLGDAEGLADNYSVFISVLEERDVTRLILSNPEEMYHIRHHLEVDVEVLTIDEIGPMGPTDRHYLLTPFESRGMVPLPQIRHAGTVDEDCAVWGGFLPLFKHTVRDISSNVGDHLVTGDPLAWQVLVDLGRDVIHVVDLLQ